MFLGAQNFNHNLSNWNISKITSLEGIFLNAASFNGNISSWDISNVTNMYGCTPLHIVSFQGHIETARQLLSNQANPNVTNMYGDTPLSLANLQNHSAIVSLLETAMLERAND